MKEAFGGTFMLKLVMIFFVIYVTFLTFALQIAKTYRIKNYVINYFEQHQFKIDDNGSPGFVNQSDGTVLETYLSNIPYNINSVDPAYCQQKFGSGTNDKNIVSYKGMCVQKKGVKEVDSKLKSAYYKVYVFIKIDWPFMDIKTVIPISGETMTIRYNY